MLLSLASSSCHIIFLSDMMIIFKHPFLKYIERKHNFYILIIVHKISCFKLLNWNMAEIVYRVKSVGLAMIKYCNCPNTFNKTICHRLNHGHKIQQTLKIDLNWTLIIVWWLVFDLNRKYHLRKFLKNMEMKFCGIVNKE